MSKTYRVVCIGCSRMGSWSDDLQRQRDDNDPLEHGVGTRRDGLGLPRPLTAWSWWPAVTWIASWPNGCSNVGIFRPCTPTTWR